MEVSRLKPFVTTLAGCALALALTVSAHAQANIGDCEKIKDADAYNQCLAKFGPPAKIGTLKPEKPGDIKTSSEDAAAGSPKAVKGRSHGYRRHGRGRTYAHRSRRGGSHVARGGGRKRMVIKVGK